MVLTPPPTSMVSLPAPPMMVSLSSPPLSVSLPSPPSSRSLPSLPVSVSLPRHRQELVGCVIAVDDVVELVAGAVDGVAVEVEIFDTGPSVKLIVGLDAVDIGRQAVLSFTTSPTSSTK